MMTPEVATAIEELREHFQGKPFQVEEDTRGGAFVVIDQVELQGPYTQVDTWVGFHITHTCPYADVYPHFLRGDLTRLDGAGLGEAMGGSYQFPPQDALPRNAKLTSRPAVQVSRRSNHREPNSTLETTLIKLLKVLKWISSR
jgi:hypothetical protein